MAESESGSSFKGCGARKESVSRAERAPMLTDTTSIGFRDRTTPGIHERVPPNTASL